MTEVEAPTRRICKPNECDPDYACEYIDETGEWHYLTAIDHALSEVYPSERDQVQQLVLTPLGSYRPLPQARKFHQSLSARRWAIGGNRSSKSKALAVETVWLATDRHPWHRVRTPNRGWYATTTWPKLGELYQEHIQELLRGIPHRVIWHNRQLSIPAKIYVGTEKGNSIIECKAYEQGRESFQATALDYIHFDEQCSEDIFIESITRIGSRQNANFAAAFTPIIPQPWLEKRLVSEVRQDDAIFSFPLDDNRISWGGFIPDERIDALVDEWPPDIRETRRLGKWGSYRGQIFSAFKRELHVVAEEKERRLFFLPGRTALATIGSIDWGGSNPFAMIFACRVPHLDNDWYIYDEVFWDHRNRGGRRLADLANDIKDKLSHWKTVLTRCYADHDPTNVLEMRHCGIATNPAVKVGTADEIGRVGIEPIQSLLQCRSHLISADFPNGRPQLHVAARCVNLIREISTYKWQEVPDDTKRSPRNVPLKVDDHLTDCLRYLISSENRHSAKILDIGSYPRTFR